MIRLMGVDCVLGFLLLTISSIQAQGYVLDEPDFSVWESEEQNPSAEAEKIFAFLCENYQLSIDNKNVDCSRIQFGTRESLLDDNYHILSKRDAGDDTELEEGSGHAEGEISLFKEAPVEAVPASVIGQSPVGNNGSTNEQAKEASQVDLEAAATNEKQLDENEAPQTDIDATANENPQPAPAVEASADNANQEPAQEAPIIPEKADEVEAQPPNTDKQEAGNEDVNVPLPDLNSGSKDDSSLDHEIPRSETTIAPPVSSSEAPAISSASPEEHPKVAVAEGSDKDEDVSRAVTQKVLPSDLAEVETLKHPKESEVIDDQQSGNAVLLKEPKILAPVSVEGSESDKQLAGIETKANINNKVSDSEQPNTGESTKNVAKAGKDTTILVVLFAVVIVIGAAAFTHNFIKKRKQRNLQNSEVVNGIRRSLQNLTGNGKNPSDIEQGTEMKPLMKTNSPVVTKEYLDTKKEAEA